jgi:hypothetical protein
MDFLDLPLSFENGRFRRAAEETTYVKYVQLFFASRKYEALPALDFGMDLDDLSWITNEEYVRVLVEEFNRVHRGSFSLHIEGQENVAGETKVAFSLRKGREHHRFKLAIGSLNGA